MKSVLKSLFVVSILGCISIMFHNCSNDQIPVSYEEVGICFETEIFPILISNCTMSGCHNPTDRAEDLDYTTYEGIMESVKRFNPEKSKLYEYITTDDLGKIMPPPPSTPLTAEQINLIHDWIEKGAPETINCFTVCDTLTNVSFSMDVLPILDSKCNGCHSGPTPQGGIDQSTWSAVIRTVNDGSFLGSIVHEQGFSPMPPLSPKLPPCEILIIETWVNEGALDN